MQTQSILRAINKDRPKLLTIYQNHSFLNMLSDFDVYCLILEQISPLKQPINMINVTCANQWEQLDFDLCVGFSGGIIRRILQDISRERKTDLINYEMDFPIDIGSDLKYRSSAKNSLFPSESFKNYVFGNGNIIFPYIGNFLCQKPIQQRAIQVCTIGDNLIETELSSHFSDWHDTVNTLAGCQIFGHNPRLGTVNPTPEQTLAILNDTRIYLNLKTSGYFPIELLQAISCGCVVISYEYPGIDSIVPKEFIVKNKKEARALLSELIAKPHIVPSISEFNANLGARFRKNQLSDYISKKWNNIHKRGFDFYKGK